MKIYPNLTLTVAVAIGIIIGWCTAYLYPDENPWPLRAINIPLFVVGLMVIESFYAGPRIKKGSPSWKVRHLPFVVLPVLGVLAIGGLFIGYLSLLEKDAVVAVIFVTGFGGFMILTVVLFASFALGEQLAKSSPDIAWPPFYLPLPGRRFVSRIRRRGTTVPIRYKIAAPVIAFVAVIGVVTMTASVSAQEPSPNGSGEMVPQGDGSNAWLFAVLGLGTVALGAAGAVAARRGR